MSIWGLPVPQETGQNSLNFCEFFNLLKFDVFLQTSVDSWKLIFWGYLALLFCVLFSCLYLELYYLHWGPLFFLWLLQEKRKRKLLKHVKYNWKSIIKKNHSVTFMENWHSGEWRGRGIIPAISTTLKEIVALLHCFFFLQHFIVSKSYDSLRTAIPPSSSSLLSTIHFQESNLYGRSHREGFASESERHSKIEPKKGLSSLIIY